MTKACLLLFVLAWTFLEVKGSCAEGWTDKGTGFCYSIIGAAENQRRTWSDAENYCQSAGPNGHLMIIDNELQQRALKELMASLKSYLQESEKVYIGLSDTLEDNVYRWSDGLLRSYQHLGFQEKLSHRIDCSHVVVGDLDAMWNIDYCFLKYSFICQMPINTVPRTPTDPSGYSCPDGFETNNADGICYHFPEKQKTYCEAMSACPDRSSLMLVQSAESQSFLTSRLRGRTWIGLEYRGNGNYEWYDQSLLRFENWRIIAKGSNTRCTSLIQRDYIGEWFDDDCERMRNYVCTMPAMPSEDRMSTSPRPAIRSSTTKTTVYIPSTTSRNTNPAWLPNSTEHDYLISKNAIDVTTPSPSKSICQIVTLTTIKGATTTTTPRIPIPSGSLSTPSTTAGCNTILLTPTTPRSIDYLEPFSTTGLIGVSAACAVLAIVVIFVSLIFLKQRGAFAASEKQGFENPVFLHTISFDYTPKGTKGTVINMPSSK